MIMYGGQREQHSNKLCDFADKLEAAAANARKTAVLAFDAALAGDFDGADEKLAEARDYIKTAAKAREDVKASLKFGAGGTASARLMSSMPAYESAVIFIELTKQNLELLRRK